MLLIIAGCMLVIGNAAARDIVLKTNPFLRPVEPDKPQPVAENNEREVVAEMQLRATMVAGERSQANIGGKVLGLGEEINGYQLIEVHPLHVVLDRDGKSREIRIADNDRGSRD
jgi:hypothetical protein